MDITRVVADRLTDIHRRFDCAFQEACRMDNPLDRLYAMEDVCRDMLTEVAQTRNVLDLI